VGPNGAGKTTTINIVCGLLDQDGGSVRVNGAGARAGRRGLGVAPQETAVYEQLTSRENLRLFGRLHGLDRAVCAAGVDRVIDRLHLGEYAEEIVARLSGGWRRRVHIGVALVHSPSALILDEPTSGLDVEARHALWGLIESLRAERTGILMTTHDLDEAERLCTRVGILSAGRIIAEGTMDELRASLGVEQVAEVETDDDSLLRESAASRGWQVANRERSLLLGLQRRATFEEVAAALGRCRLTSLRLRDVTLEDVYLELTRSSRAAA